MLSFFFFPKIKFCMYVVLSEKERQSMGDATRTLLGGQQSSRSDRTSRNKLLTAATLADNNGSPCPPPNPPRTTTRSTVERDSPIPMVDKVATEVTGCGTLEAAAEAAADRKSPRLMGGSEVRTCVVWCGAWRMHVRRGSHAAFFFCNPFFFIRCCWFCMLFAVLDIPDFDATEYFFASVLHNTKVFFSHFFVSRRASRPPTDLAFLCTPGASSARVHPAARSM